MRLDSCYYQSSYISVRLWKKAPRNPIRTLSGEDIGTVIRR